jgi:hypothetical protein
MTTATTKAMLTKMKTMLTITMATATRLQQQSHHDKTTTTRKQHTTIN